jgi:hypothetical protein
VRARVSALSFVRNHHFSGATKVQSETWFSRKCPRNGFHLDYASTFTTTRFPMAVRKVLPLHPLPMLRDLIHAHDRAWQNQLVVLEQPVGEFYKDEGGKSNFMTMIVGLPPGYTYVGSIPLKASLYFESERRVEEKDQTILNLMGREYTGYEITPENPTATFEFRLEKVSFRCTVHVVF